MEITNLKQYLEMVASVAEYSVEAVVLKHGKEYPAPAVARPRGIRKGANRMCYKNAYHVVTSNAGFTYVEGFANSLVPVQHAWALDAAGNVVETTWETPGSEYYGIALDIPWVNQVILETMMYGVLDPRSNTYRSKYLSK